MSYSRTRLCIVKSQREFALLSAQHIFKNKLHTINDFAFISKSSNFGCSSDVLVFNPIHTYNTYTLNILI